MPNAANKALARRSLQMWGAGAAIEPEAVFAATYRNHQEPAADGGVRSIGRADWAAIVAANHAAFPDLRVEILRQIAEGDLVASHWRFTATHLGPYEGAAGTGRQVSWTGVQIDRIAARQIVESWVSWDKHSQFDALGLIRPGLHGPRPGQS